MDLEALIALGKRLDEPVGRRQQTRFCQLPPEMGQREINYPTQAKEACVGHQAEVGHQGGTSYREVLAASLLWVRDKRGRLVKLECNAAQKEFESRCGARNIVLKARQMGISTWVAARFFLSTITRPGTLTVQVAHTQEAAEEIFRMVHRFVENLPRDLEDGALRRSKSNRRQLVFPRLDSEYRVETAGDANAGRGLTIQNLHCSEVARWGANAAEVLASLRAAVPPGGEIVLESTANGTGGCFYREWQRAPETGYVRHFFPWWMDAGYRIGGGAADDLLAEPLTEEELWLMGETTPRQRPNAGRGTSTPASQQQACWGPQTWGTSAAPSLDREQITFRRQVRRDFGERAVEEFAEDAATCFLASGSAVFDTRKIEAHMQKLQRALDARENGRILVWLPAARGREYILGVDAAGGGSEGDYACVQVIDRESGLQCAELYGHYTPEELASHAARLGREYNDGLLVVERNNHGHAVLAMLERVEQYGNIYADPRSPHAPGWSTTILTRPAMLERFGAMLVAHPEIFLSRRLLEECRGFVRRPDGKAAAAEGSHDDAIMAMAMALAVRDAGCANVRCAGKA